MIVADSDVLIDALRGRDPGAERIALELRAGTLSTTVVTVFELLSGARNQKDREAVGVLLRALRVFPLDSTAAGEAAEVRRTLDGSGVPIPMADCLIAGICRANGAILLTRNRKHFERVPDLSLGTLGLENKG